MTSLTKPVRRESSAVIRERGQSRPIIITLEPPCLLKFRAKGCKRSYAITANQAYCLAVRTYIAAEKAKKAKEKKERRGKK